LLLSFLLDSIFIITIIRTLGDEMILAMASKAPHGMVILLGEALLPSCPIALLLDKLAKYFDKKSISSSSSLSQRACFFFT